MQAAAFTHQIRTAAALSRLSSTHVVKSCLIPSTHTARFAKTPTNRNRLSLCNTTNFRFFSATTTMASTTRVVEHIVLLKVREGVSTEQQEAMVSGLRSLKGLQTVIELSAGKATQVWPEEAYTHALHCRYMSKEDLDSYANDPYHLEVINKYILPIVEDRLAIDWEADVIEPVLGSGSYGAMQIAALKPKEDVAASEFSDIMDMLRNYKTRFPLIKQVSIGKNFCSRAKGFEWAFLAFFSSPTELAELTKNEEHVNLHQEKVLPAMEKIMVLDYHTT